MKDIIKQWNTAASKYTEDQENSEYAQSNKQVIRKRFQHIDGEKILDLG